jgi:hypothetical protein
MPKGYWAASGKFSKGIGKPLGNAQIPKTSQWERREYFPAAIGQKSGNFHPFSLKGPVSVHIY